MSDTMESLRSELAAAKADLERARLALDACKDAHFAAQSQHEERAYALATATARIAELERVARIVATHDVKAAVAYAQERKIEPPRVPWTGSDAAAYELAGSYEDDARYTYPARDKLWSAILDAALAPNAPPKVDDLPPPYIGTPGRQGCHPEGCPMPGLHTITSCNWLRQQLHRFGRHVTGCTLNGEDCSCGLLQMLAGRPLAATRLDAAPHAEGEPGEER